MHKRSQRLGSQRLGQQSHTGYLAEIEYRLRATAQNHNDKKIAKIFSNLADGVALAMEQEKGKYETLIGHIDFRLKLLLLGINRIRAKVAAKLKSAPLVKE